MNLQELTDKRAKLAHDANQILSAAKEAGREFMSPEEEQRFDAIHADIDKLEGLRKRIEKQGAVEAALTESTGRRSEPNLTSSTYSGRVTASEHDRSEVLRAWLLPAEDRTDAMRASAQRCNFDLNSRAMTWRLSPHAMRSSTADGIREWKERNAEYRAAMGTTSGAVGSYTVPDEAMRALEVSLLAFGGMRQVSTIIRTATGADLPIPTTNDTANKGAILTENTTASEVDVTFGQIVLQSFMYSSKYVLVSRQLLQDSAINVPELLGRLLGERIARIQNDHFTTATGTGEPNGIVNAAGAGVTATSLTTSTTYDFLVDLVHSVDPAYRTNGKFMTSDAGLKMLKKIKVPQYSGDTTGIPLWSPGLAPGQPDTILGYPFVINQSMTAPATTVKSIIFGDLSKYLIRDVMDITVQRLEERFAEYHQVGFLAFSRADGDLLDAGTDPVKIHQQG